MSAKRAWGLGVVGAVAVGMSLVACGGNGSTDEPPGPDAAPDAATPDAAPGPPILQDVALTPAAPSEATPLRCTPGEVEAGAGLEVTFAFAWLVGNQPVVGATEDTLTGDDFARDDEVRCEVTPSAGGLVGDPIRSAAVTIGNTAPSASDVALTPSAAFEGSTLSCQATTLDLDGDVVALAYAWTVDGVDAGVSTSTLDGAAFARGDAVVCTVTPTDGLAAGTAASSAPLVISNSAPTLAGATLTPADATESSTLTCAGTEPADADGDVVTVSYAWTVNDVAIGATEATLTGADFSRGDVVGCTVTPTDGTDAGASAASATVLIANAAPTVPGISLSPASPLAGYSDLTCAVSTPSSDADGDTVTYAFGWTRNGMGYAGATSGATSSVVPASATADGEVWVCSVTASDGSASSTAATATVTVEGWTYIGYRDAFAVPATGLAAGGYLLGQALVVPSSVTLYGLGMRMRLADADTGRLALYTDSGGVPGTLVASVELGTLTAGPLDRLLPGGPVSLAPGTYWLMWNFSGSTAPSHTTTGAASNTIRFVTLSYASGLPPTAPAPTTSFTGTLLNLYLITN